MMDEAVEQALILSGDALTRLHNVLAGLHVFTGRMRANLELTGGAIMAEAIMMALADNLGRQHAHETVHHAATAATAGHDFTDVIAHDAAIASSLTPSQLRALLDPASHTRGRAPELRKTPPSESATTSKTEPREEKLNNPLRNAVVPEDELILDLTEDSHSHWTNNRCPAKIVHRR